jgi:hypothetical protein
MTNWSAALARAFREHLKTSGSCGPSGSELENAQELSKLDCTTLATTGKDAVVQGGCASVGAFSDPDHGDHADPASGSARRARFDSGVLR